MSNPQTPKPQDSRNNENRTDNQNDAMKRADANKTKEQAAKDAA